MAFGGRRVVFSGPFRARLALTLTDAADAAPFPQPGVAVYLAKPLGDGETIEIRAVAHHML